MDHGPPLKLVTGSAAPLLEYLNDVSKGRAHWHKGFQRGFVTSNDAAVQRNNRGGV